MSTQQAIAARQRRSESGFTLVELAIVMIIIGLLIGGILKGQELIANAQVTSAVTQIKGIDAAASTFKDSYNAVPGDFAQAATRLSATGCNGAACANGTGDGRITEAVGVAVGAYGTESVQFFNHMRAADLITGMTGTNTIAYGEALPSASIGGGFTIGFSNNGGATGLPANTLRVGHYLVLDGVTGAVGAATGVLSPTQAARIDRKMDDGSPNTGSVQAGGGACQLAGPPVVYDEANSTVLCAIYARIQN